MGVVLERGHGNCRARSAARRCWVSCSARLSSMRRAASLTGRLRSSSASARSHRGSGAGVVVRCGAGWSTRMPRWSRRTRSAPYSLTSNASVFLLVPLAHRFPLGCGCFDVLGGVDHAGIVPRRVASTCCSAHSGSASAVRGGSPQDSRTCARSVWVLFGRGAVLGAGLAPAEPTHGRESGAGGGLVSRRRRGRPRRRARPAR